MSKRKRISLYQCSFAQCAIPVTHPVRDMQLDALNIFCAKGVKFKLGIHDGTLNIERLERGMPLEMTECQTCKFYDEMGDPLVKMDRGNWRKTVLTNVKACGRLVA